MVSPWLDKEVERLASLDEKIKRLEEEIEKLKTENFLIREKCRIGCFKKDETR